MGFTYTSIPNEVLQGLTDPNAITIWTYLCTMPESWVVRPKYLQDRFSISRRKYYVAMRYLREVGLVWQNKVREPNGTIKPGGIVCSLVPRPDLPVMVHPVQPDLPVMVHPVQPDLPVTGKPVKPVTRLVDTHRNKESLEIKQEIETEREREPLSGKETPDPSPDISFSSTPVAQVQVQPPATATPKPTATRIPLDWRLTDDHYNAASRISPDLLPNIQTIADTFKDHYLAASGASAKKADWLATWRNWCRRELNYSPKSAQQRKESGYNSLNDVFSEFIAGNGPQLNKLE